MPGVDVVFFDWGGVLSGEGFINGLNFLAAQNEMDADQLFHDVREVIFESGYVYGRCSESEFWGALKKRIPLNGDQTQWREEILSRFKPRQWMFDIVRALKAMDVRVAVLSDQVNWLDELEAKFGFSKDFEKVFNSYHYGWTKSEPEFFHLALKEMGGVEPSRAMLVDDATTNVRVAREVGLEAIYYDNKEQFLWDIGRYFPDLTPNIP